LLNPEQIKVWTELQESCWFQWDCFA